MINIQTLNNHVLLVKPEFHITTGRKKLCVEDLRLPNGSKLPPKCLVSLGSKKVIDPSEISVFTKLRDQAKTICEKVGIKFLGGFAVPFDKADDLLEELDSIISQFTDARTTFLNNYDSIVDRWCKENPSFDHLIREAVPSHSQVAERLSADYAVFQVNPIEGHAPQRLERQVQGLSDQLYRDIANIATKFLDESIFQRRTPQEKESGAKPQLRQDGVTQKALRTVRAMRDKMASLSFLDSSINVVIGQIDSVLRAMPSKGHIRSKPYADLYQLTLILSDEEKMKMLAEGLATGESTTQADADFFDDMPLETDEPVIAESLFEDNIPFEPADEPVIAESLFEDNIPFEPADEPVIAETLAVADFSESSEQPLVDLSEYPDPFEPVVEASNQPLVEITEVKTATVVETPAQPLVDQPVVNTAPAQVVSDSQTKKTADLLSVMQSSVVLPDDLAPVSDESEDQVLTEDLAPIDLVANQSATLAGGIPQIGCDDDWF